MAKIDLNAVLDGEYDVRVGNEYEIAPNVWGVLRPPTKKVQDRVFKMAERAAEMLEEGNEDSGSGDSEFSNLGVCKLVLALKDSVDDEDVIPQMAEVVVNDFFILLTATGRRQKEG